MSARGNLGDSNGGLSLAYDVSSIDGSADATETQLTHEFGLRHSM